MDQAEEMPRLGSTTPKHHDVDDAIKASERLVRESTHALKKLREERERSEKVLQQGRQNGSSARNGKGP